MAFKRYRGVSVEKYHQDSKLPHAIIVDIDDTIARNSTYTMVGNNTLDINADLIVATADIV